MFKHKHKASACECDCAPAPTCCDSAPQASCGCASQAPAGDCCGGHPGFFARMKARCCKSAPACDGCGDCGGGGCQTGGFQHGTMSTAPIHAAPIMTPAGPAAQTIPATPKAEPKAEPIQKMPKDVDKGKGTSGLTPPSGGLNVTPTGAKEEGPKNPFDLDRRYEKRVGRAADYSRLTGQLFFVHADGGLWVLRYAPLSKEDENGGSVVLGRDRHLDSYRDGDLVTVEGAIVKDKGSLRLGGPLYRVNSIQLIDRPQQ
jgi:hypothetical protein